MLIEAHEENIEEVAPLKNYIANVEGDIIYSKWEANSLNMVEIN